MKKIELIEVEMRPALAWPLKIIALVLGWYFLNDVYHDLSVEYIVRRGTQYTLAENPSSFSINVAKRVVFGIIGFYLAVWGVKLQKNQGKSEEKQDKN